MSSLWCIFIILTIFHLGNAERRILDGKEVHAEKGYVVYLVRADATVTYDAWICGGAIVAEKKIVTSAACVEDVKHMYAVAGYNKYSQYKNITDKECKAGKKKIVYICIPAPYKFSYDTIEKWANIDIAVVHVESSYEFNIKKSGCSHAPTKIEINYEKKYQEKGTDALVYGWGHNKAWRKEEDKKDYNQPTIRYGSVKLADLETCIKKYPEEAVKEIIKKYMICSMVEGDIDDAGDLLYSISTDNLKDFCGPTQLRMGDACIDDPYHYLRRGNVNATRRRGICQNDHGGPLITWRGSKDILIGIASVFKINEETRDCEGPFLYTSTYCNAAFLHCLVEDTDNKDPGSNKEDKTRKYNCDDPEKLGFQFVRRTISWIGHPDGPAENEIG